MPTLSTTTAPAPPAPASPDPSPQADFKRLEFEDVFTENAWTQVICRAVKQDADYDSGYLKALELELTEHDGSMKKLEAVAKLWGYLIWSALDHLQLRTHGVGRLARYFEDIKEYERVLYGVCPGHYRAHHAKHVFTVFLHGWMLLDRGIILPFINLLNRDLSDFYGSEESHDLHRVEAGGKPKLEASTSKRQSIFTCDREQQKSDLKALWTIAALCHDLGIPLQKTVHVNEQVQKMFKSYGGIELSALGYRSNFAQEEFFASLLRALSHVIHGVRTNIGELPMAEFRTQQVLLAKRTAALIETDHGIASALLVWKTLEGISDILVAPSGPHALDAKRCCKFIMVREALAAIADHANKHLYSRHCNLAFLLRVCDQASERYRPRASSLFPGPPPLEQVKGENLTFIAGPPPKIQIEYNLSDLALKKGSGFANDQEYKRRELSQFLRLSEHATNPGASEVEWRLEQTYPAGSELDPFEIIFYLEKPERTEPLPST